MLLIYCIIYNIYRHPDTYSSYGLTDEDFVKNRPKNEIMEVFSSIGYTLTDEEFEKIYNKAVQDNNGNVSLENFRNVMNEYLSYRDEGEYPQWW